MMNSFVLTAISTIESGKPNHVCVPNSATSQSLLQLHALLSQTPIGLQNTSLACRVQALKSQTRICNAHSDCCSLAPAGDQHLIV